MSVASVNLLRERVIRAAIDCVEEVEGSEMIHTAATKRLVRAVKALQEETWRHDEAPAIIRELLQIVELEAGNSESMLAAKVRGGAQESVLRAKAFLGERQVSDDTTPVPRPRRGILRRAE